MGLADQTAADFARGEDIVEGDVFIGAGEGASMRVVARHVAAFRSSYPNVRFHLHSGVATELVERLERGLDDVALLMAHPDNDRYEHLRLPRSDAWGVVMRADDPLARKETVEPADLLDAPLVMPERSWDGRRAVGPLGSWFGAHGERLDVAATFKPLLQRRAARERGRGGAWSRSRGSPRRARTRGWSFGCSTRPRSS